MKWQQLIANDNFFLLLLSLSLYLSSLSYSKHNNSNSNYTLHYCHFHLSIHGNLKLFLDSSSHRVLSSRSSSVGSSFWVVKHTNEMSLSLSDGHLDKGRERELSCSGFSSVFIGKYLKSCPPATVSNRNAIRIGKSELYSRGRERHPIGNISRKQR